MTTENVRTREYYMKSGQPILWVKIGYSTTIISFKCAHVGFTHAQTCTHRCIGLVSRAMFVRCSMVQSKAMPKFVGSSRTQIILIARWRSAAGVPILGRVILNLYWV